MRVAVIAGTPVDTQMGVEYIENKNREIGSQRCEPIYLPAASDCDAQLKFQYSDDVEKRFVIDRIFDAEIEKGTRNFFIYCNSLSGSFDFDSYEIEKNNAIALKEKSKTIETAPASAVPTFTDTVADTHIDDSKIHIYTPLQVYRKLGAKYKCLGVMAAHNLSTHAIEEALMSANPDIYVIGTGNMSIVHAIEDGMAPAEIVKKFELSAMTEYMKASGAEAMILGCTHFPYFKKELQAVSKLEIIDPADEMYASMMKE